MSKFSYKARNNEGQLVTGQLEADSQQEILQQLGKMQYTPVTIAPLAEKKIVVKPTEKNVSPKSKGFWDLSFSSLSTPGKVKVKDVMVFCSNLSSMSSAGVPLLGALNTIAEQFQNPAMTNTLRRVAQLVSQGSSFSDALAAFPRVFSPFFVSMVKVGEMSGTLDSGLKALAIYLEKQERLRQTVRGILIYPSILMIVGTAVVTLILVFLMPKFVAIFTKANVPLPIPTKILYGLSLFIRQYWMWIIGILLSITGAIVFSFQKQQGRYFWQRLFINMPVVGDLIKKTLCARFCRTLGIMLESGVSLLVALKMVKQTLDNVVFAEILEEVYESAEKGEGIHKPLLLRKEIPKDVSYMISVGEQSGNIGSMLNKVADFYETKIEFEVKDAVTLIEPTFIVILGGVVGVIMASMILPLFDMIKTLEVMHK